jgi:hypothetical protein
MQVLEARWQTRKRLEQELAEDQKQKIAEANARQDVGILNALGDKFRQQWQAMSEDDQAYFWRKSKRRGFAPLIKAPSRGNTKVVEALEDEKFLYREQLRVFDRRHRKGAAKDAREERATVRRIVADFHHLTVSQLTNFEKNKGRTPKIP